jgi:hypothetical protein
MKRRFAWLAVMALGLGVAVLLYRGPGRGVVRGHVGDVAATMLVYALLGLGGCAWAWLRTCSGLQRALSRAPGLGRDGAPARSTTPERGIGFGRDVLVRAAATLAFAAAVELGQTLWHASSLAAELTIGGTFDGWDFVAYVAGVAIAVAWEITARPREPST